MKGQRVEYGVRLVGQSNTDRPVESGGACKGHASQDTRPNPKLKATNASNRCKMKRPVITRPHKTSEMIDLAAEQGTPATRRLIADWTEKGMIYNPPRRSLGRGRGTAESLWSPAQVELFLELLLQRARGVSHHAQLCNLPVAKWLDCEGYQPDDEIEVVPFAQARRALLTWADAHRTESARVARRTARTLILERGAPSMSRAAERWLTDVVVEITAGGDIDARRIEGAAAKAFGSATYARSWTRTILMRLEVLARLDQISEQHFRRARQLLNDVVGRYALAELAAAVEGEERERRRFELIDEAGNTACLSLLSALGHADG
jgi:hypothetical protein